MKNYIFKILSKLFSQQISDFVKSSKEDFLAQREKSINQVKRIELEMLIGQPVISISNEWKNPIVGVAVRVIEITQSKTPMIVIKDYITGEEFMPMGWVAHFTHQRLSVALKLNPFELASLLYTNECYDTEFTKNKSGVRDSEEVVIQKLQEHGFFEFLEQNTIDKDLNS